MNREIVWGLLGVASYLMGAVPSGYLVARARGVDIRKVGSGNVGATNVFRCVGKPWGILTFVADALKGFVPAAAFPAMAAAAGVPGGRGLAMAFAMLAVVGHNWPVFLGFRGGKGVATSAGGLLGVAPAAVGCGSVVWVVSFLLSRYVSVASLLAAAAVAAGGWVLYRGEGLLVPSALTVLAALIVYRHRGNIARLRAGTENRFDRRRHGAAARKKTAGAGGGAA